jgi:two-component system sensor histidine kinase HupT/HoxJ
VRVSSRSEGGCAIVSITDNGPGVPPQIRGKLFEPFFTTKSESAGTGLGLAISHSIVTRIGGGIHCDPAYEDGARFVITLPLAQ